jgi:hypothetical protein
VDRAGGIDRNEEVVQWQLAPLWRSRDPAEGNLVFAQHGALNDVAEAFFW